MTSQCRVAHLSFTVLEGVAGENEHPRFGTPGFEDQTMAAQRVQDNADMFEIQLGLVIVFGHSIGDWASCSLACNLMDEGLFLGNVP